MLALQVVELGPDVRRAIEGVAESTPRQTELLTAVVSPGLVDERRGHRRQ
jgi:hypothetical protein